MPALCSRQVTRRVLDEAQPCRQRYDVRGCGHDFDGLTNKTFMGHHQPLCEWLLCLYSRNRTRRIGRLIGSRVWVKTASTTWRLNFVKRSKRSSLPWCCRTKSSPMKSMWWQDIKVSRCGQKRVTGTSAAFESGSRTQHFVPQRTRRVWELDRGARQRTPHRSGPGSSRASLPHPGDQRRKLPSPRCQTPPSPRRISHITKRLHRDPVPRPKEPSTTQRHQIQPPRAAIFNRRQQLEDPRSEVNLQHPLVRVVVISLMAVLAGPTAIARWAKLKVETLRKVLPLPDGVPQKDVYRRVSRTLQSGVFQVCFTSWLQSLRAVAAKVMGWSGRSWLWT